MFYNIITNRVCTFWQSTVNHLNVLDFDLKCPCKCKHNYYEPVTSLKKDEQLILEGKCSVFISESYWWQSLPVSRWLFPSCCGCNQGSVKTRSRQRRFETWIQADLQYNEPVLKCTELLFYMQFTSSLPTALTSDCLNSSVSFSRAAALSNVPCRINDTISPAALRSLLLMWFYRDVNAPVHSSLSLFVAELIKHWCLTESLQTWLHHNRLEKGWIWYRDFNEQLCTPFLFKYNLLTYSKVHLHPDTGHTRYYLMTIDIHPLPTP